VAAEFLGIELVPAAVRRDVTFLDAAEALTAHPVSALAVLDDTERVVGVFGGSDLLRGLFPRYLGELHHTAFVRDDPGLLERCARAAGSEPVHAHMHAPLVVEDDASATHVAELFLHSDLDALPVVRGGRFLGMLGRSEFCREMLESASR
jgi:CBS domain-containing protein